MWKKTGWAFVGIYTAAILYLNILAIVKYNGFNWSAIVSIILTLLPAGVVAIELSGKKTPLIIILPALLITAVLLLGNIKFNSMGVDTIAKAALFGTAMLLLSFFAYKRIFKK